MVLRITDLDVVTLWSAETSSVVVVVVDAVAFVVVVPDVGGLTDKDMGVVTVEGPEGTMLGGDAADVGREEVLLTGKDVG